MAWPRTWRPVAAADAEGPPGSKPPGSPLVQRGLLDLTRRGSMTRPFACREDTTTCRADGLQIRPQASQEHRLADDGREAPALGFEHLEDGAIDGLGLLARIHRLDGGWQLKNSSRASGPSTRRRTIAQPSFSMVSANTRRWATRHRALKRRRYTHSACSSKAIARRGLAACATEK